MSATLDPIAHGLPPVVVGAGPAGISAVRVLVAHGLSPVLVDEAPKIGGQIYRQPPDGFTRSAKTLYGLEASRAQVIHRGLDGLTDSVDYRPQTLVWSASATDRRLELMDLREQRLWHQPWHDVILSTGATDRILPMPGWTLPGVYSLGASQIALKYQGCVIGQRVVLAGTGPLLYLVAYQYRKAGAQVSAVLDTARTRDQWRAMPAMLNQPAVLAKGLYYVAWLKAHGVRLETGVRLQRVLGDERVQALRVRLVGQTQDEDIVCDAVGVGHALRAETQLADLLDCEFQFDVLNRAWLPRRDAAGRSTVAGVYLAGDGAGIMGADAAQLAGERAALALLADRGVLVNETKAQHLEAKLARIQRFRVGLEHAFPFPQDWAALASDELVVCRCEQITAGEIRQTVRETGACEINRLKALCRAGMGRCQGRMCSTATAELLAHASDRPISEVGRLRAQAPVKPLPMTLIQETAG